MDIIWEKIKTLAESSNGLIRTSQVESKGICRPMLKKYVDKGLLERVRKGIYILSDDLPDEYALLQAQCSKAIFSYGTALYFWELSDRVPHCIDITVPHGTNISTLRRNNENIRCHYVQPEFYGLGITKKTSPQGGEIYLYDRERCICDIIRNKEKIEAQIFTHAIKGYFGKNTNMRTLLKYGKAFGIEDKIRTYSEVLI